MDIYCQKHAKTQNRPTIVYRKTSNRGRDRTPTWGASTGSSTVNIRYIRYTVYMESAQLGLSKFVKEFEIRQFCKVKKFP